MGWGHSMAYTYKAQFSSFNFYEYEYLILIAMLWSAASNILVPSSRGEHWEQIIDSACLRASQGSVSALMFLLNRKLYSCDLPHERFSNRDSYS